MTRAQQPDQSGLREASPRPLPSDRNTLRRQGQKRGLKDNPLGPPWLWVELDCLLYKNVILHETLAIFNKKHGRMFTQFVLNKAYCWVVLNILLFRLISPVCFHSFSGF